MNEIKSCPFCGSEDVECKDYSRKCDVWFIQCQDCYATFPHFDSEEDEPVLVIEKFTPTDDYGWCKAKYRGEKK